MYFKNDYHEKETVQLLKKLGKFDESKSIDGNILQDVEYGALAYIIGATYKADFLERAFSTEGIELEKIYEIIGPYSSAEKGMIRFALQCFNSNMDDIKFSDAMYSLDGENTNVIKQAIDFLY